MKKIISKLKRFSCWIGVHDWKRVPPDYVYTCRFCGEMIERKFDEGW